MSPLNNYTQELLERLILSVTLEGRTALITGSTSGIGRATAEHMAAAGARVIVTGRDELRGQETLRSLTATGATATFLRSDLGAPGAARELAEAAVAAYGRVDILVNNAGVFTFGATEDRTEGDFDDTFALNVRAPFFLVAHLAPLMAERGAGAIINVGTGAAHRGAAGTSLYGASKAALNLMTLSWAAEYGPAGVRTNSVSPGMVLTEGTAAGEEGLRAAAAAIPAGRYARPEEIAKVITFLASDDASYVQGAIVAVDGGATAT